MKNFKKNLPNVDSSKLISDDDSLDDCSFIMIVLSNEESDVDFLITSSVNIFEDDEDSSNVLDFSSSYNPRLPLWVSRRFHLF